MGLTREYIRFIEGTVAQAGFRQVRGLKMCELGNQLMQRDAQRMTGVRTGKEYFTLAGYDHISIDWNGRDGALPIDLREAIEDPALVGQFDVLTNSGTSEHVADQYGCFRNMHRLIKPHGLLIHLSPQTGSWPGHGFHYYTFDFHRRLADVCRYELIAESLLEPRRSVRHRLKRLRFKLVCVGVRKTANDEFISRAEFDRVAAQTIFSA